MLVFAVCRQTQSLKGWKLTKEVNGKQLCSVDLGERELAPGQTLVVSYALHHFIFHHSVLRRSVLHCPALHYQSLITQFFTTRSFIAQLFIMQSFIAQFCY